MKVERKKEPKVLPLVITLETLEEQEMMWHLTNVESHSRMADYLKVDDTRPLVSFKVELWELLDSKVDLE